MVAVQKTISKLEVGHPPYWGSLPQIEIPDPYSTFNTLHYYREVWGPDPTPLYRKDIKFLRDSFSI